MYIFLFNILANWRQTSVYERFLVNLEEINSLFCISHLLVASPLELVPWSVPLARRRCK